MMVLPSCQHNRHGHDRNTDSGVVSGESRKEGVESEMRSAVHPLDFKLYMERSGSMVSFDSEKSKGDFKAIVSTLLNRFPKVTSSDSTSVYIVNDNIYPYEGTVKAFLGQRDFFSSTKSIGDPSYTAFDRIFEMILADTRKYQVSALVTDLIYSVNGQETVSASKLLNEAYSLTHNVFKGKTNTSVIVLQMEADYNGLYYPYNSPNTGVEYSGDRPFYILLFASKDSMTELYNAAEYKSFINFSTLNGFENMFCFTKMTYSPKYAVVLKYEHKGRFQSSRDDKKGGMPGIIQARLSDNDELTIPVAIDLSEIPLPNNYKKNKEYYEVNSDAGYTIENIQPIEDVENPAAIKEMMPSATHLMILRTVEKPKKETVSIKLAYKLPAWVKKTSTDDDSRLSADNFEDTTFGLKEVMEGMFNAYVPEGSNHYLFDIKLSVDKK